MKMTTAGSLRSLAITAAPLVLFATVSNAQDRSADLALVAGGFTSPVALAEAPDDSGRLFVV